MKTRSKYLLVLLVVLLLIGGFIWLEITPFSNGVKRLTINQSVDVSDGSAVAIQAPLGKGQPIDRAESAKSLIEAIFTQGITINGRVLDQDGRPVEGARVRIGVHDKLWEAGSSYFRDSDVDGRFEISGVKGAAANVEVSKGEYYSGRESRRVLQPDEITSVEKPVVFRLFKKGGGSPIIYRSASAVELEEGGAVAHFSFSRARFVQVADGSGLLRIEITASPASGSKRSWQYSVSLPGGGLQKRSHEFEFIAPASNYEETIRGGYLTDHPDWRGGYVEELFARLPDGTSARFQIVLGVQGYVYARIHEMIYNPDPSNRDLELNIAKVIKPAP